MSEFMKQYGAAIIILVAVVIILATLTPIGDIFVEGIKDMFGNLTGIVTTEEATTATEEVTTAASMLLNRM